MTNSGYEMQLAEKDDRIAELGAKLAKAQELVEHRQDELASVMRANDNKFNTIQRLNAELEAARAEIAELVAALKDIGDFAHDRSSGPAIEDDLWEVRRMAYDLLTK